MKFFSLFQKSFPLFTLAEGRASESGWLRLWLRLWKYCGAVLTLDCDFQNVSFNSDCDSEALAEAKRGRKVFHHRTQIFLCKKFSLIDFSVLSNSYTHVPERQQKILRHTSRKCVLSRLTHPLPLTPLKQLNINFSRCCFSLFLLFVKNLLPLNWRKLKRVRRKEESFSLLLHV